MLEEYHYKCIHIRSIHRPTLCENTFLFKQMLPMDAIFHIPQLNGELNSVRENYFAAKAFRLNVNDAANESFTKQTKINENKKIL